MHLSHQISAYNSIIIIYIIMKLEDYKKLVNIEIMSVNGLNDILEANKAYQNNEIEKSFENAKIFKPLIDNNKELIDRIEKKTDQTDELIKNITDALPYYNQQLLVQQEPLTYDDGNKDDDKDDDKDKKETLNVNFLNSLDNDVERNFINDLIQDKKVYLYTGKSGKNKNIDIYSDIKLIDLNDIQKYSISDLENFLNSEILSNFTKQLSGAYSSHKNDTLKSYISALGKYKKALNLYINGRKLVTPKKNKDNEVVNKVEGEGIKKRRNGYKIVNSKYNDKIKINMDLLYNNYYVQAWYNDDIIYENQGDKDTVELLTKGRINKHKKYSKLSQQILNDMITLSGMVKKRNGKNKLLDGSSNIILSNEDLKKRIQLLRGSILAGNDNQKLQNELSRLTNQENVTKNKSVDDLYQKLKTLTSMKKTSEYNENVHNQIYNIIDYLRSNRYITRDQYHKYIKKHLI